MIVRALLVSCVVLASLLHSVSASAQSSDQGNAEVQPCETNSGIPGALYIGQLGTLLGPEVFDAIALVPITNSDHVDRASNEGYVTVFNDVRFEQQFLVLIAEGAKIDTQSILEFRDASGNALQSCLIGFTVFDPSVHDFARTQVGFCDLGGRSDVLTTNVGTSELYDLPEKYVEGVTSPYSVLRHQPEVGARQVRLLGKTAGYATFAWLGADTGKGMLKGVCRS